MQYLIIAAIGSAGVILLAVSASIPTYRYAPAFLLPVLWMLYALRRRLNLHPLHFALLASALLLHMLGALGFYQRWAVPISFDIVVHYYFALVITLALYRGLEGNFPLRPWQLAALSFMFMMGLAALHEVMEYCSYLILGEQRGMLKPETSYFFDTQRDLTSNLLGTLSALAAIGIFRWTRAPRTPQAADSDGSCSN